MKFDNKTVRRIAAAAVVVLAVVVGVLFFTGRLDGILASDDPISDVGLSQSGISSDLLQGSVLPSESVGQSSSLSSDIDKPAGSSPTVTEPSEPNAPESTAPPASEPSEPNAPESTAPPASEPSEPNEPESTAPPASEPSEPNAPESTAPPVSEPSEPESSAATAETTLHFRNNKLLQQHYEKHGKDMGFSSAEEYERAAAAVPFHPEVLHKIEAEDGDDVYYIESTNEFVVVSTDGYLRTYFNPDRGIAYYNKQ